MTEESKLQLLANKNSLILGKLVVKMLRKTTKEFENPNEQLLYATEMLSQLFLGSFFSIMQGFDIKGKNNILPLFNEVMDNIDKFVIENMKDKDFVSSN